MSPNVLFPVQAIAGHPVRGEAASALSGWQNPTERAVSKLHLGQDDLILPARLAEFT